MAPKEIQQTTINLDDVRAQVRPLVDDDLTVRAFHELWYRKPFTWGMTTYLGVSTMKNPLDLWIQQEIIQHLRPTVLVETGTAYGGSALFYAKAFDAAGLEGRILSIDLDDQTDVPAHGRIRYLRGRSSVDPGVLDLVHAAITPADRVMVILDSDHRAAHVRAELDAYAPLVTPSQFLIVEDTNMSGHPVPWDGGPGPREALDAWLATGPPFERDALAERYLLTMHPGGWLRRRA